jgi:hypothetical protein
MTKINVFVAGVYSISCKATGRRYIGQSHSVILRIATHVSQLYGDRHINKQMQQDWNQYGPSAFSFDIIKRIECARERCKLESSLISNPRLRGKFYNNTIVKNASKRGSRRDADTGSAPPARRYKSIPMKLVDHLPPADLLELLTLSEAARLKSMSLNKFKYHALRGRVPLAVGIGMDPIPFWYRADVLAWNPNNKNTRKGVPVGAGAAKQGDQP